MSNTFRRTLRSGAVTVALASTIFGTGLYVVAPASAYAIYCANCSTLYQQMFEYAEAVNTQLNTAQQLATQIQQYENMVKQGLALPDRMFNSLTSDLQRVTDVYNNAQSLGRNVADLESKFKQQFQGYDAYLNSTGKASEVMPERYKNWSQQGLDNARTAMQAAGINTSTFATEDSQLDQLVSRSQSAAGRLQAIQAGNEIAASNVQQLQKLRDLLATQITLQGNYMAQQQERSSVDDAFLEKFFSGKQLDTGSNKGF